MDWANERYVKVYTRDECDWLLVPLEARCLYWELFRHVGRSTGRMKVGSDPIQALAAGLHGSAEFIGEWIPALCKDGCIQISGGVLFIPNFVEAQLSRTSGRVRTAMSREREKPEETEKQEKQDSKRERVALPNVTKCYTAPEVAAPAEEQPAAPAVVSIPLIGGEQYSVTQQQIDAWSPTFPAVDVTLALRRMAVWCEANKNRRKTGRGIERAIVTWLSRDQDNPRPKSSGPALMTADQENRRERERQESARQRAAMAPRTAEEVAVGKRALAQIMQQVGDVFPGASATVEPERDGDK
jgi:hypothetical protein